MLPTRGLEAGIYFQAILRRRVVSSVSRHVVVPGRCVERRRRVDHGRRDDMGRTRGGGDADRRPDGEPPYGASGYGAAVAAGTSMPASAPVVATMPAGAPMGGTVAVRTPVDRFSCERGTDRRDRHARQQENWQHRCFHRGVYSSCGATKRALS